MADTIIIEVTEIIDYVQIETTEQNTAMDILVTENIDTFQIQVSEIIEQTKIEVTENIVVVEISVFESGIDSEIIEKNYTIDLVANESYPIPNPYDTPKIARMVYVMASDGRSITDAYRKIDQTTGDIIINSGSNGYTGALINMIGW